MSGRILHCYRCRAATIVDTDGRGNLVERTVPCVCPPPVPKPQPRRKGPAPAQPGYRLGRCIGYTDGPACGEPLTHPTSKRCHVCAKQQRLQAKRKWDEENRDRRRIVERERWHRRARKARGG
jgi:hypothetical protein